MDVFSSPWSILPESSVDVHRLLAATELSSESKSLPVSSEYYDTDGEYYSYYPDEVPTNGLISVISITGIILTRSSRYIDMQDYARMIQRAAKDENVIAIVLCFDSPGGMVNGLPNLGAIISEAAKVKPVVSFVEGLCCSAAMWLASCTKKIYCADNTVRVGSIGVMTSFVDTQPALEKMGYKFHQLYSSLSPDKNKIENDVLAGKYEAYIKEVLDPLALAFIDQMKKGRRGVKDEALTGKVYFANDAAAVGLVDKVMSFSDLIADLSKQKTNTMSTYNRLAAVLGCQLETHDGGSFLNEAQLAAVEAALNGGAEGTEGSSQESAQEPAQGAEQGAAQNTAQNTAQGEDANPTQADTLAQVLSRLDAIDSRLTHLEEQPAAIAGSAQRASDFAAAGDSDPWAYASSSNSNQ